MARTFGVKSVGRGVDFIQRNQDANPMSNQRDIVYSVNNILDSDLFGQDDHVEMLNEEPIAIEGQLTPAEVVTSPGVNQPTNPISKTITDPMKPTDKGDSYYADAVKKYEDAAADKERINEMKGVLEVMETASGLVDSYFKHKAIVNQNNYNVMQANRQIMAVKSQAAFATLREQTKAQSRQASAKLDAVARGQSSTGDVAGIAENNEEMFLAQNLMGIEISAARAILGLEQDIVQYEASSRISEYQRNASMVSELAAGGITLGTL